MPERRIYLSAPDIGNKERQFVEEAFDTNWVAPLGPNVDAFEEEISDYIGNVSCALLSSGTAAIHLALRILGIQQNDEVICQSFTFCGSVNPVLYEKAIPVFIDSEINTWNMDPQLLEDCIQDRLSTGKKPKAIIYVHLYGMPALADEILSVAGKYEIPVIEDAAEALGAKYKEKRVGNFGSISILSFNGNKIITTGGGGAFLSGNPEYTSKARFLSTQARDDEPHYQHSELGFNYRLSNVSAGIGRGQLLDLENKIKRRREIFSVYKRELEDFPGMIFHDEPENSFSNRWLTTTLVHPDGSGGIDREKIRITLEGENIESRPLWKPMHLQPLYQDAGFYGNGVSESLFKYGLCLPSGSGMTDQELDRVISTLKKCIKNLKP
jgi:dTDP-4-amino-4,6-dideoxygalactose transaminase